MPGDKNINVNKELEGLLDNGEKKKKKMSKGKKLLISALCILLAAAIAVGTIFIVKKKSSSSGEVVYREYTAQRGDILVGLTESSVITLDKEIIEFPVGAEVLELYVRSGSMVEEGDPLVKMSTDDIEKSLAEYEEQLEAAKKELDSAILTRSTELEKAANDFDTSSLGEYLAEDKYNQSTLSAQLDLNNAQTEYSSALKNLNEVEAQSKTFSADLSELNELEATMEKYEDLYNYWSGLQSDYNSLTKNIETVRAAIKEIADVSEYSEYEELLEKKEDEIDETLKLAYEAESGVTINDVKELKSELKELQSYDKEISSLFSTLSSLEEEKDDYNTVSIALNVTETQSASEEAKEKYNDFKDDFTEKYGKITTQDEMDEAVTSANSAFDKAVLNLEKQNTTYEEEMLRASQTKSETLLTNSNAQKTYDLKKLELDNNVATAQTTYDEYKEELDEIKESIGNDGIIVAPCSGVVSSLNVEVGDEVTTGNNMFSTSILMTITNMNEVNVSISITEDEILDVSLDQDAVVSLSAFDDRTFDAKIESISVEGATMGAATVTYTVNVAFTQDECELYDGMNADVTLIQGQARDCVYIQKSAITTEDGKAYVSLKGEDGNGVKTRVVTGFTDGQYTEILQGLDEGDTVLVESGLGAAAAGKGGGSGSGGAGGGNMQGFGGGSGEMPDFGNMGGMPDMVGG